MAASAEAVDNLGASAAATGLLGEPSLSAESPEAEAAAAAAAAAEAEARGLLAVEEGPAEPLVESVGGTKPKSGSSPEMLLLLLLLLLPAAPPPPAAKPPTTEEPREPAESREEAEWRA